MEVSGAVYYSLHPVYAIYGYSLIVIEFMIAKLILLAAKNRLPGFIFTMSKNVSYIYIVQWVIISVLSPMLALITNIWIPIIIGIAVLVAACFLGKLLRKSNLIRI